MTIYKHIYLPLLLLFTSCATINHTVTRITVGLSMKKHEISHEELVNVPKKYFPQNITIGKFKENYFLDMRNDSSLYHIENSKDKSVFSNLIVQPLNCMFFDESNKLIAAYSICDADLVKTKLTWNYYLSKRHIVKNIDISHNVTFGVVDKYIEKLAVNNSKASGNKVVLCWSKIGGRQTKNYFKEFSDYLSKSNYNIYVVNCDEAINKLPVTSSQN
jgi:hypothetical protein